MMEFEMENKKENQNQNERNISRSSQSSIFSNPELKDKKVYYLRISLIIINIISAICGFYIFQKRQHYLSKEYNFEYYNCLLFFVVIYSLGMVAALIFSFLFSALIKLYIFIKNIFSNPKPLILDEDRLSENSIRYINIHSDEVSFIPYALTFFVISTAVLYFISLPYSLFLLLFMTKNEFYSNFKDFKLLYFFLIINAIGGLILFYVLLIIAFVKRDGSFRKISYYIDDNNLNSLRNEIRGAMQKAEQIII